MPGLDGLYLVHSAWAWAAAAAGLFAIEVVTGSGWLLWPAASGGVVAVLEGFVRISTPAAVLIFAVLTIASTAMARRYFPRRLVGETHDINDPAARVVGHEGRVASAFHGGIGRVFVDGKEWAAELSDAEALEAGARVTVTAVVGARLKVRAG